MSHRMIDRGRGVRTRMVQSRFHVQAPYNEDFLALAHELDGRWRRRTTTWSFDVRKYSQVASAVNQCFGTALPKVLND